MNGLMKGTLALVALTLVLAIVLAGCGSGNGGGASAGGGSHTASKTATSGKATTGGKGKYHSASSAATTTKGASKSASSRSASKSASKGASGGALKTIVIEETEFQLSPSTVTLSKPGTYAFKAENNGSTGHSLEIDGTGVKSKGGEAGKARLEHTLDPGESGVLTVSFQKPGTYEMYCPLVGHRLAGMKGSVVVR